MIRRCLALSMLFLASAAFASAESFDFTYNGTNGDTASGTLITTPTSTTGEFLITSITNGLFDGSAITLLSPGAFPAGASSNDNLLFDPGAPAYLDPAGFSFSTAAGTDVNLYYNDEGSFGYAAFEVDLPGDPLGTLTVTELNTSPTPEPSSLLLLGTGLLGAFAVLRRKVAA